MAMIKRVFFLLAVNIAVMFTIGIIIQVFGLNQLLAELGPGSTGLLVMCFVWGMAGSFISLLISRWMVKRTMGVQVIDPNTHDPTARELVRKVHFLAQKAGIQRMPEVGVYDSAEINAFATGATKNKSIVAVSTGLLQRMNDREVEGVLGHEVAHIANGDMVTMTLVQGVVNSFVMFFSYIVAQAIVRGDDDERGGSFFMEFLVRQALMVAFGMLSYPIVAFVSRWREFHADEGGARLAGKDKMIAALQALKGTTDQIEMQDKAIAAFKISGKQGGFLASLMMTHPPLDARIEALSRKQIA